MVATEVLKVRVPPDTKQIVRTLAQQQQLTESALLMRLVQTMLQTAGAIRTTTFDPLQPVARGARLSDRWNAAGARPAARPAWEDGPIQERWGRRVPGATWAPLPWGRYTRSQCNATIGALIRPAGHGMTRGHWPAA